MNPTPHGLCPADFLPFSTINPDDTVDGSNKPVSEGGSMYSQSTQIRPSGQPGWLASGGWYLPLTILSAGLAAWIPFAHAAGKLHSTWLRWMCAIYAAGAVTVLVCGTVAPVDAQGNPVGAGDALSTVAGVGLIVLVVAGCVQQWPLRGRLRHQPVDDGQQAVSRVLAARARRAEARKLAAADPRMAHELGIGRPDLPHPYDDGGLVDLNSAPAASIARACGVDDDVAEQIVRARTQEGAGFANLDELLVLVDVPVAAWDRLRDRAIVLPL